MANRAPLDKYERLATEYSKLRAQARVLKKAVLDEQAKGTTLREQLRQRETSLRRSEQEVDSLGFRNKQLEHRVAALQEEIAINEGRKKEKTQRNAGRDAAAKGAVRNGNDGKYDSVIFEELQEKIMENAQLVSLNDDKERELQLYSDRVADLEQALEKGAVEHGEREKRLRRDLDALQCRNAELETMLVDAAGMLGNEDTLSASGSDNASLHTAQLSQTLSLNVLQSAHAQAGSDAERIALLEKEVSHWRSQYEITKINGLFQGMAMDDVTAPQQPHQEMTACSCSLAAAGITVAANCVDANSGGHRPAGTPKDTSSRPTKEQLLHNSFSMKFEDLLKAKCMAESRVGSFELECDHLRICLEEVTDKLKAKDEQVDAIKSTLQMLEEDLATVRVNYEEQISVLTEQVISLSDQLAACK